MLLLIEAAHDFRTAGITDSTFFPAAPKECFQTRAVLSLVPSGTGMPAPPASASTPLSLQDPASAAHSGSIEDEGPKLDQPKRCLAVHHGEDLA